MPNSFDDLVQSISEYDSNKIGTSMPPSYPMSGNDGLSRDGLKNKYTVHYGRFVLAEDGNADLERIMNSVLDGICLLLWEKTTETKEGDVIITVKYLLPVADRVAAGGAVKQASVVRGRRRIRKAKDAEAVRTLIANS